jgi:hypothetical protein
MEDSNHLTGILGIGVVGGIQQEEVVSSGGKVLAWPVPFASFDHHHQAAGFPWRFG